MMYSKSINDVVFFNNKIYLATDFGLVVLNDDKHEVYESYIYEKVFSKLVVVDDYLLALIDNQLYISLLQPGLYDFNEHWSANNYELNTKLLRNEWGYEGFVVTDWWPKLSEENSKVLNLKEMVESQNDVYMPVV